MNFTKPTTSVNLDTFDIPKPTFIIVGSAKCGTTTLADVLANHPDCCFSRPKEVNFFNIDSNYTKGWEYYKNAFSHYASESVIGEATPNYAAVPSQPNCAERIYSFNPEMKIVYIVRHPYKKLVSSWKMHYRNTDDEAHGAAIHGFEHYVKYTQEKFNFLDNCLFNHQIDFYKRLFPGEQIKVMFLEDWSQNPISEASNLMEFLGLDLSKLTPFDTRGSNRAETRKEVRSFFQYIGQSSQLKLIRRLLPSPIRKAILNSSIASRPTQYPPPTISLAYKRVIIDYLKQDALSFLKEHGKPESFWDFRIDYL